MKHTGISTGLATRTFKSKYNADSEYYKKVKKCVISSFRHEAAENCALLVIPYRRFGTTYLSNLP